MNGISHRFESRQVDLTCRVRSVALTIVGLAAGLTLLTGCMSSGKDAPANPYLNNDSGRTEIQTLRVFGDSYSVPSYIGTATWPRFVSAETSPALVDNYAIGGATAASTRASAFNRQLDSWSAGGAASAPRDLTVVYFGHNDIGRAGSGDNLGSAAAGYREGVSRLIDAGAAADDRRVFVTQIHDWSRNPGVPAALRDQVVAWNGFVASEANRNPNVIAVDLYTVFERLYNDPGRFGFTNVATVDAARASVDALYLDDLHFGPAGQRVIAKVFLHYLTRGWDWASRVDAGSAAAVQLENDINSGLLLANQQAATGEAPAWSLLPIGAHETSVVERLRRHALGLRNGALGDAQGNLPPGGMLLSYRLDGRAGAGDGPGQRLGVSVTHNHGPLNSRGPADWTHAETLTDSLGLHWQQDYGSLLGVTQLGFHAHRFEQHSSDRLLALTAENRDSGHSWRLSHRFSGGLDAGSVTVVPNLTLAYQQDTLHGGVMQSLYTSQVDFQRLSASHSVADLGLAVTFRPILFGNGRALHLAGTLNHEFGLHRDALEVRASEQRAPGIVQVDRVERDRLSRDHLGLSANLLLSDQLQLGLHVRVSHDRNIEDIATLSTMNAHYRF
jgi:lysophospholipase L1-like esterase